MNTSMRPCISINPIESSWLCAFWGFNQSASAKLIVSVPQQTNLVARSGDGSIKIERVAGRLELSTGDGSIRASEVDTIRGALT